MSTLTNNENLIETIKEFLELNKIKIGENLRQDDKAIFIDFEDIAEHSIELSEFIINRPMETLQMFEDAIEDTSWILNKIRVRLNSLPESQHLKIRDIRAKDIGKIISINGTIRIASEIRPRVTKITFECPSCGTIISVLQTKKETVHPSTCSCGRKGGFKELTEDLIDSQVVTIEEAQENMDEGSEQPKRIRSILEEDLTDKSLSKRVIPGSRIKIIGVVEAIPLGTNSKKPLTTYDIAIKTNNIIPMEEDFDEVELSEEDKKKILEISKRKDLMEYLSRSVSPSIYGNESVKKALTLYLFGGVSRERSDGSFSREQIHGLMVGDPGCAKSVMLKYMKELSQKSRYVSDKGASGVGLTATAIMDETTKTWALEAGAMVLANNGHLFVDEIDKMGESDRSNLHEGMSVGTISVSRANIQAVLNAKTSVLAAANPKLGRFDVNQPFAEQIKLSSSLLSRFDFIFVIRDIPEEERDTAIADKIFGEHNENKEKNILAKDMYRKYINYAKSFSPELTKQAINALKKYYIGLRNRSKMIEGRKVIPIGARQLEGLIRLSEASGKMRLSNTVEVCDAEQAIEIMENYLKEVGYDEENNTFDIDKISGNSTSQRGKMGIVKEAIEELSNKYGGKVPIEGVCELLDTKYSSNEVNEIINKIIINGDAFKPKKGYVHLM